MLAGGEFKSTLQEEPGAASVILALSRDQLGIGYSGIGLQTSNVRILPVAENEGMLLITLLQPRSPIRVIRPSSALPVSG